MKSDCPVIKTEKGVGRRKEKLVNNGNNAAKETIF